MRDNSRYNSLDDLSRVDNKGRNIRKPLIFTMIILPIAIAGGYFSVQMSISAMDPSALDAAMEQAGSIQLLIAVSIIQTVIYALICGFFGYILAGKTGLMRPFRFESSKILITVIVSLIGGAVLSLDAWTFARWIPELDGIYEAAGSFDAVTWIASILYGGIIEEVMMRLFLMSLLAFIGWKIFFRKEAAAPVKVFIAANIIAAAAFAAGHLPATIQTYGTLSPLLIFRCFLLNGAFGLVFGRIYRKYGIQYAMLAHMLFHIVSRTIWLIAF